MNQMITETHSHPEVELWLKAAPKPGRQSYDRNGTSLEYLEIYQGSQQFHIQKDPIGHQAFATYCKVSLSSTL